MIEDAAEAVGSKYRRRKARGFGDVGTFSFHGSKTLRTGKGGMLDSNRRDVYDRVLSLRDYGRKPGDRMFVNYEVAFKYKIGALQAAFGLAQLEPIDELIARKREIFGWYAKQLAGVKGVSLRQASQETHYDGARGRPRFAAGGCDFFCGPESQTTPQLQSG